MALTYKNFASSTLNAGITASATQLTVATSEGTYFPASGDFMAVLWDAAYSTPGEDPNREIIQMTLNISDTFDIVRAQEGTSAAAWDASDNVAAVITAGLLDQLAGNRTATYVVAATDARSLVADAADYQCDGTADDVQIQAAIDACDTLGFGKVILSEGTFTLDAPLVMKSNVHIQGQGIGVTTLTTKTNFNDTMMENENFSSGGSAGDDHIMVTDMTFDGNSVNQSGSAYGLWFQMTANVILENLEFYDCKTIGIQVEGEGGTYFSLSQRLFINNITIQDCGLGMNLSHANRWSVVNNVIAKGCSGNGIRLDVSEFSVNNLIASDGTTASSANTAAGIWFRNFGGGRASNIYAITNAGIGIYVEGFTHSVGNNWIAAANSNDNNNTYSEIYFDSNNALSWGQTSDSVINNIVCGNYATADFGTNKAKYGMEFESDFTGKLTITNYECLSGGVYTGAISWPTSRASLVVTGTVTTGAWTIMNGALGVPDGMTAPSTASGYALIYVDSSDGDLKVKFGDGTVRTLAVK